MISKGILGASASKKYPVMDLTKGIVMPLMLNSQTPKTASVDVVALLKRLLLALAGGRVSTHDSPVSEPNGNLAACFVFCLLFRDVS